MPESNEIQGIASIDRMFLEALEWHLGKTFANSSDRKLQGLWCYGILDPLVDLGAIQKVVHEKRMLVTTAFIGHDGQERYAMRIHFGPLALRRVARKTSMLDCIPDAASMDWITLDMQEKKIEIRLK
jgi:hypothetical protein